MGIFAVIALFVRLISIGGFVDVSITLADLLSGNAGLAVLSGSSGKGMAGQIGAGGDGSPGGLEIGAWLLFATAIFLASKGVMSFLARR